MNVNRRELLKSFPLGLIAAGLGPDEARASDGLIVRMQEPKNLETPLADLKPGITPNDKFYVRNHFAMPSIDWKAFTLTVDGHVQKQMLFTLEDLKKIGSITREITMECAGNSRVFLVPQARGLQWGHGAVGNAKWTGVPLGAVLERVGLRPGVVDVVLTGADKGAITSDPPSPGAINFERSLPLEKAKKAETLLAWEMNGEALPHSHGGPLRAIVGGWYGMSSVKWLTSIAVLARPYQGFFQTMDYSIWDRKKTITPQLVPLAAIQPKAIITSHGQGSILKANMKHAVSGLAWAGENRIDKVELSIDGGKSWTDLPIENAASFTWVSWSTSLDVGPMRPEPLSLVVRATDNARNTQPASRDPDRRSYMINHTVPVEVLVR